MKSLFAFVFAFFVSVAAFADENETNVSVEALGETTKFALRYDNATAEKVNIRIYNENNKLVHAEKINKNEATQRIYDLSAIGAGTYKVVVLDGEIKETQLVTIGAKTIANDFVATLSPAVAQEHIFVALDNNNGEVELRFSDSKGNILYTETISEQKDSKFINVEALPSGWYTLEVVGADKTASNSYFVR